MRVLFVGSVPDEQPQLDFDLEINSLKEAASHARGVPVAFDFHPAEDATKLAQLVRQYSPTVLHLSCHGAHDALHMADGNRKTHIVTVSHLRAILRRSSVRALYLNACKSAAIAEALTDIVDFAIGTTAEILDRKARIASSQFYRELIDGSAVDEAYHACSESFASGGVLKFFPSPAVAGRRTLLYQPLVLVARFDDDEPDNRSMSIGVLGAPVSNLVQLVVFTTEEELADEAKDDGQELEEALCEVARGAVGAKASLNSGEIWTSYAWNVKGDITLFACIGDPNRPMIVSGSLSDALRRYYKDVGLGPRKARRINAKIDELAAR
jgi:hypothetical protein